MSSGRAVSSAEARIGRAAFFDPETRTSPRRRFPPLMTIFCKAGACPPRYAGAPPSLAAGAAAAAGAAIPACSSHRPPLVRGFRHASLLQIL